ncbi:isopentenyl-diphosphate Delta-isomerase [Glaciimonas immobilis]|uniref:Isopentenyl-diphosphate Delta-isomerase n=1 Tax=Glaciimonas immobilis TaxID=728004 RepID=A0A840RPD7_9BURK|nr:isopentenyl-diphosphate Delta-isomerase [Glaciimonas immobilis]KAF3999475.1 isopentenyl-diphosphate Delta-isomerase [Glaciimonas immobilis]MBB5198992.1 isopentenyl-diphosphate delta-isomerase [Glaciimonas immobilis]
MEEVLILVDHNDQPVGFGNKLEVHQTGTLHRAFSIFIFNSDGHMLLQQRSATKYHSGKLWTNTCCGHPRHGEDIDTAAHRRLQEEMGFNCYLQKVGAITYQARVSNELIENEFDHIFIGKFDDNPVPNPAEVEHWKWISAPDLLVRIEAQPDDFTIWFKKILMEADGCLEHWQTIANMQTPKQNNSNKK